MRVENIYNYNYQNNINFGSKIPRGFKRPQHIKNSLVQKFFMGYHPIMRDFGSYQIPVHNEGVNLYLHKNYTSTEFKNLFEFTKKKGSFDYIMDNKTGFIKTSFINRKENPLMSDLIWITDSCNNLELVKEYDPKSCTKVLNKLADLYEGQQKDFDTIINNPKQFAKNGFYIYQGQTGVGHCFVPKDHRPHKWFARTRLESVGNYLQNVSDIILTGFKGGKYGYKTVNEIPENVINSIPNCTKYLKAIHYPTARSCGAWEEQTFVNSLSSDTAIINQGLRNVMNLMYSPTNDKNLLALRTKILNSKHGDVFSKPQDLKSLLKDGEQRIINQHSYETISTIKPQKIAPDNLKYYDRKYDAAMSFIPQTEKIYPDNILLDSLEKISLLENLEKNIVRPNGAIRYKDDEYLNLDYHTLKDVWKDNKHSNEAEWFLVSEISSGYGAIVKNILDNAEKTGQKLTGKTKDILLKALSKETEHINRSYARITPKNMVKSNKYSCPAYKIPEAYEAVTTKNGTIKYVPGAHPLTWAQSSLHKASNLYLSNLERIEKAGIELA